MIDNITIKRELKYMYFCCTPYTPYVFPVPWITKLLVSVRVFNSNPRFQSVSDCQFKIWMNLLSGNAG